MTPDPLAEIRRLLAEFDATAAKLTARLDRMEAREAAREPVKLPTRRKFRPLDLSGKIGG